VTKENCPFSASKMGRDALSVRAYEKDARRTQREGGLTERAKGDFVGKRDTSCA